MFKWFVILALICVVGALGYALFCLVRGGGSSEKMYQALGTRVALSVLVFMGLLLAAYFGVIEPR